MRSILVLAALALSASPLLAQDRDAEKKKILEEVEKRLRQDDEQLLREIEKLLDDSLKGTPAEPKKVDPPPAPPKKGRAYIGVLGEPLTDDDKKDLNLKGGVKVRDAVKDGPAAKAGLQAGDVITAVDGRAVAAPAELPPALQAAGPGARVRIEYLRAGKKQTADVTLAVHPDDAPAPEDPKGGDLRERVKKFMQKQQEEAPKAEAPRAEAPKSETPKPGPKADPAPSEPFALDETMMEQLRAVMEQLGVEPGQLDGLLDQFLQKGDDGKFRLNDSLKELMKGFDPKKFFGGGEEAPAPKPAPKGGGKPWFGFYAEPLPDELRAQLDVEAGVGMLITEVRKGGPAEKAGLLKNDVLTKIDGKPVRGEDALPRFLESAKPGQEAALTLLRKGKEQTLKFTLGERKDE